MLSTFFSSDASKNELSFQRSEEMMDQYRQAVKRAIA
jgi:hypothetical protein